jgi:hypothetical protein
VRRDPRYTGYLGRNQRASASPTDIQIILAAIAGRLGEIGQQPSSGTSQGDDEDDLAREPQIPLATDDEDAQDQQDDENAPRALPVTARTRMAFTRLVKRYAAATRDAAFIEELGPVVAATNAAIFNHLLAQLIERDVVDPGRATDAQIALWSLLWGTPTNIGLIAHLDTTERSTVDGILADIQARQTTLCALAASGELELEPASARALRDQARHLIVNKDFSLDEPLVHATEPHPARATTLLDELIEVASASTPEELDDFVLGPLVSRV